MHNNLPNFNRLKLLKSARCFIVIGSSGIWWVNPGINPIGLIFRVYLLVIYFWGDGELWRLNLLLKPVRREIPPARQVSEIGKPADKWN